MRKIEFRIIDYIVKNHTRPGPWACTLSPRDVVEKTEGGVIKYRLFGTAVITIKPWVSPYFSNPDTGLMSLSLHRGRWRTSTTLSRFNAFLTYFVGATCWQNDMFDWIVSQPGDDHRDYEEGMAFIITRLPAPGDTKEENRA